jgi:hypothetical protein
MISGATNAAPKAKALWRKKPRRVIADAGFIRPFYSFRPPPNQIFDATLANSQRAKVSGNKQANSKTRALTLIAAQPYMVFTIVRKLKPCPTDAGLPLLLGPGAGEGICVVLFRHDKPREGF